MGYGKFLHGLILCISKFQNRDGVVSPDDFERYIMSNPNLFPMFVDIKDRVRMDSITQLPSNEPHPTTTYVNRGMFVTSQ
jgi:hypothetical protein